jgi:hypothetical protein
MLATEHSKFLGYNGWWQRFKSIQMAEYSNGNQQSPRRPGRICWLLCSSELFSWS